MTGKVTVNFPGFPGAMGTLKIEKFPRTQSSRAPFKQ